MRVNRSATLTLLPLLAAAAPPQPELALAAQRAIVEASNRGDRAALGRLLLDGFVIHYRTIDGVWHRSDKARSIRAWTRVDANTLPSILRNQEVAAEGETAVVFAEIIDRERIPGGETRSVTRVTDCFVWRDRGWRLLASDEIATCAGTHCR